MSLLVIPATIDTAQITSTNATDSTTAWSATTFTTGQTVKHLNRRYEKIGSNAVNVTCTFTNGSATVGATAHGRAVDDVVRLTTTGTLPTGFATGTDYFVVSVPTADTLTLSATSGGSAIVAATAGSGTHTLWFAPGSDIVDDASGNWIDIGPTNDFAMFDDSSITQTERATSLTVTLTPGSKFDTVGLINLSGVRYVTISVTSGGTTFYSETYKLFDTSFSEAWYSAYHSVISYKTRMAVSDIPPLSSSVVTITLSGSGTVKCGGCHVGLSLPFGDVEYGAAAGYEDYVRITFNEYGTVSENNGRGYSATFTGPVFASYAKSAGILSLVATRRGSKTLFLLAPDANSPGGWDPSGIVFGLPTNFKRRFQWPSHNEFDLEVKGIGSGDALEFSEAPVWNFAAIETLGTWALTRASSGTRTNSSGVLESKSTNVARYEYQDGELQGLLIEGARTNLFLNALLNGTSLSTQSVTVTAQAYTISFYGTGSITLSGVATAVIAGNGAYPERTTYTFTPSAGSLTCTVSGTVQYAQIEAGSTASSFIPTAGSTVTRASDLVTLTSTSFSDWWNVNEGTFVVQAIAYGTGHLFQFDGGSSSTRMYVHTVGTTIYVDVILGATPRGTLNLGTFTPGVPFKVAFAFTATDVAGSLDGAAAVSTTHASLNWVSLSTMRLGADTAGATPSPIIIGYVKTLPYRVSDAALPGLTT